MWVPAFLSWPFALPSLPSISLPANIQKRFLSYVLKRALGKFIKDGGLDVERIQAQVSEGWVEIEGLELDTESINDLSPSSLPISLSSGSLSKITAQVPFPNLWSDPLSLTLETLHLDFDLAAYSPKGKEPDTPRAHRSSHPFDSPLDLTSSVTSAADDFLHEELDAYEEAELDRSIRQSLILNQTDPFQNDELPGAFPFPQQSSQDPGSSMPSTVPSTTALASLVERILARLQLKVRNIVIRIRSHDKLHGAIFELRIGEIRYADESQKEDSDSRSITRALRISLVNIYTSPFAESTPATSFHTSPIRSRFNASSSRSSSTSSISTSSSGDYEQAAMTMSLAVADLRQSMASSTLTTGASVYQSALSEQAIAEESPDDLESSQGETINSRSATPTLPARPKEQLLLSFGNEEIVLRMKTTPPVAREQSVQPAPTARPSLSTAPSSTSQTHNQPSIEVDMGIGTIAMLILPQQVTAILCAVQTLARATGESSTSDVFKNASTSQPAFSANLRIRGVHVAGIYDMDAEKSSSYEASATQFWSKPATTYIPYGQLKVRFEGLAAAYISTPYISRTSRVRIERTPSNTARGRRSSSSYIGPAPPIITATVNEVSIFEYLASESASPVDDTSDLPPGGAFPVLIFDSNMIKQYEAFPDSKSTSTFSRAIPAVPPPTFPEFDTADWRQSGLQKKTGGSEKQWKVRPKGRGVLKTAPQNAEEEQPAIEVRMELSSSGSAAVDLQPIHAFLDLSLVERLLPALRYIAPTIKHPGTSTGSPPTSVKPVAPPFTSRPSQHFVLEDLDAQAASVSTVTGATSSNLKLTVGCPLLRLDLRCPAPPNRRGTWGDGGHLRSGIVTLDIHRLQVSTGASAAPPIDSGRRVSYSTSPSSNTSLEMGWEKMFLFFCRVPAKRSSAFLVIGPLANDPGEEDVSPLLPVVSVKSSAGIGNAIKTQSITCKIPFVQANIRQTTIEGLQFFADDITHWLDGAFGDGSAPKPRDDLKMIGSRFFGSKASSSASSSAFDEEEESPAATLLRIVISEADIALIVPRALVDEEPNSERLLSLLASDIDTRVESNVSGKQETAVSVVVMDAQFADKTDSAKPRRILGRTTPLTLTMHNAPLLSLRFSSLADQTTGTKETGIKLICSSWTLYVTQDLAWVKELARFAKTPEGVFEDVVPSEVTRIHLQIDDGSIHLAAPNVGGAIVVVMGNVDIRTDLISDGDDNVLEVKLSSSNIMAIDDLSSAGSLSPGYPTSVEAWRKAGYAPLVELSSIEAQLFRDLSGSEEIILDVLQAHLRITACADSLATFGILAGDMAKLIPAKPPILDAEPVLSPTMLEHSINVFASIDEDAFKQMPDIVSGVDMIEDDLPTNLDYIDSAAGRPGVPPSVDRSTGEGLRAWQTEADLHGDADVRLASEVNGETIKILVDQPFDMDENYWENLPAVDSYAEDTRLGKTRVRLYDSSISVVLHEGYDWQKTRKAIETEIKAVRKRLEKIRQLLATGQKADESIAERPNAVLFNSIYIGLDQSRENLDNAALIAAIDEELEELGIDDTASQSSWQSFPTVRGTQTRQSKTRLKGKRLSRSKKPQIEISLEGIRADVDLYDINDSTASRVHVTVKTMEILDHIKTSTWKKFLTEMKADSRGNIRETDANMVRVELVAVRPSLPSLEEELRLRAKILPLKLHVDQDALDFLKRFFSFQAPPSSAPTGPVTPAAPKKEPFFQHVEIFPVELKLDYKPKRVDFNALREGKTIELMNFFHFDGAEMTLRHITMSGVTGWERLSTMLQDIWTPDVKANQLADVISGVSPIRSMVNVGSGVADLILLPIEQYRKDGRIAKGVQRGTNSFVRSTALEMMKLGARLATGTQVILEKAEGVLGGKFGDQVVGEVAGSSTPGSNTSRRAAGDGHWSSDEEEEEHLVAPRDQISRYANQPGSAREGVQAAYQSLSKNINSAAQTILAVPMEVYERSGEDGPLKAVVRAVPIAVLKPMIGASEAVSKTLLGVRNSLDPEGRREQNDKYK